MSDDLKFRMSELERRMELFEDNFTRMCNMLHELTRIELLKTEREAAADKNILEETRAQSWSNNGQLLKERS